MPEMTLSRLDNYFIIKKQVELYEQHNIDNDDLSKAEHKRLCEELTALDNYIISITDETIKSIAIQRFIFKKKYQQIADYMKLSKGSVYRMLSQYIEKSHK